MASCSVAAKRTATRKNNPTESNAKPTTSRPVTAPPLNAMQSAPWRLVLAAWAVRTLASTAIRIPMNPAASEHAAPSRNPSAVGQPLKITAKMKMITAMTPMVATWRLRYALAPSSMALATSFIRPSPAGAFTMTRIK